METYGNAWPESFPGRPRVCTHPAFTRSLGAEAVDLAALAGLYFEPWQARCLHIMLAVRADGKWQCFECGCIVSRQNGKGSILEARALAGLYLFDEPLIMWSAHEYKTAMEGFRRVRALVDNTDELRRKVRRIVNANGEEAIELMSGQRLRFVARSKGSGRGFSASTNIIDEAYALTGDQQAALLPTLSAQPNPQVIYTSSPPLDGVSALPLFRLRDRGESGEDPALAWLDWGVELDPDDPESRAVLADPATWARTNPAYPGRISRETIEREFRSMGLADFARERCGVWPKRAGEGGIFDGPTWGALGDEAWRLGEFVAFGVDVTPDRSRACIVACSMHGLSAHGVPRVPAGHVVEVVDYRPGTAWVVDRLVQLKERWNPVAFGLDARGPAVSLLLDLEAAGIKRPDPEWIRRGDLAIPTSQEVASACGRFHDAVVQATIRHRSQPPLNVAVLGAATRPLGDAYAWARRAASVDISPLCAATVALWAFEVRGHLGGADPLAGIW